MSNLKWKQAQGWGYAYMHVKAHYFKGRKTLCGFTLHHGVPIWGQDHEVCKRCEQSYYSRID